MATEVQRNFKMEARCGNNKSISGNRMTLLTHPAKSRGIAFRAAIHGLNQQEMIYMVGFL